VNFETGRSGARKLGPKPSPPQSPAVIGASRAQPRGVNAAVRITVPFAAAGLAALALPWSTATAGDEPAFAGYNSSAWAAPVQVEVYEPTIPIPADPQFDVEMAYSRVEAETGLGRGRGSWLWPGDPVGEGAKTFVEQLGLPPELGERGYPVQVNSTYPTGPESQADEPFPGTIMRTSADGRSVTAQVGYSPDGQAQDPDTGGNGGGTPGTPGLPSVPGLRGGLQDFGAAITGSQQADEPDPSGGAPGVPKELSALVDFTGYTSTSTAETGADLVSTVSRSSVSDVSLLAGLITVESVHTRLVTASDGKAATAKGDSDVGRLSIAGNAFTIGPDGVEAAGQQAPIPGLPDDPAKALAALGVQLHLPKPQLDHQGDASSGLVQGIRIEIDTTQLHSKLAAVPLGDVVGAIPDEAKQLKSALQAAIGLSPRIVISLGNSGTATDTVPPIDLPDTPTAPTGDTTTPAAGGSGGGSGGSAPPGSAPGAPTDTGAPSADGNLTDAAPMGAGLPPLNSIPGALTVGGIGLAAAAGTWLRKLGLVALGGTGSCPHGLDSGLPDLRKA
jgi:hypothetical protein